MATEEKVELYGMWSSPFSRRVELALKIKGVQYEYREEDVLTSKSPWLLQYNPVYKKIPVLVHNGNPISESALILEYIDETWKNNPILPQDPYTRATARFWAKFVDDTVFQTAMEATTSDGEAKQRAFEEFRRHMEQLQNELRGKEFFGGEAVGFLDIMVFFALYFLQAWEEVIGVEFHKEERFQTLQMWIEKLLALDMVKECIPPRDKFVAYTRARVETFRSSNPKF